jgi:NADPH:quinone reductase-like Zn-dependent oxidoreductase
MAKVVRFYETGGPEVLRVEDATQHPGPGDVLLQVQAIGLNRADSMFMHGQFYEKTKLPARLGYEAAGIVKEIGTEVDPTWLGKRASVIPAFSLNDYGTIGEEVVIPSSALAEYPSRLSPAEGAAIWMQYLTAYGTIMELGKIQKGEFVFVTAASSSAGLAALETIRAEGGQSIAITRKNDKRAELLALGANHVVVSEADDVQSRVDQITGGKGVRIIVDAVGGPLLQTLVSIAAPAAVIIEYGVLSDHPTAFPQFTLISKKLTIRGYWLAETTAEPSRRQKAQDYVLRRINDGSFQPRMDKVFPFAQIVEAYKYLESNAQVGKIVVTVP